MRHLKSVFALLTLVSFAQAKDVPLGPGMRAPEIKVGKWLKGQPVGKLDKGTYVVEFWATWCVPCRVGMPRLSALAKNNPSVTFVGVSVWEHGAKMEAIQKFVDDMSDKMAYNVAADQKAFMEKNWMSAAKQGSIPASFLIKDGIIQWIGDPAELDKPLAQVLNGTFDLEASKKKFNAEAAEFERRQAVTNTVRKMNDLLAKGKGKETLPMAEKLIADNPQDARYLAQYRTAALALTDPIQARAQIDKAMAEKDYWQVAGAAALLQKRHEVSEYAAGKLLTGDIAAKDPMVCFLVASYYISAKNKPMALKVIDLGNQALIDLKMDEPDMKKNLDRIRKLAEAIK